MTVSVVVLWLRILKSALLHCRKPPGNIRMTSLAPAILVEIEAVCQESREAKVWANDNEQYSRRNNVRIRGLVVNKDDNCKQIVVKLCREKLRVQGIDSADIDVAHPVLRQQSDSASADIGVQKVPTVLVRFCHREHRDLVIRQRRHLKA